MENRDKTMEEYQNRGASPVVKHTNKGGNTNFVKNPFLVLANDLNAQALAYWRDLGLTPAGLKKLNAEVVKDKQEGSFEKLLAGIL